jgi:hypothetical protein
MIFKGLVLSLTATISILNLNAQLNKGSIWLSGSISYGSVPISSSNIQDPSGRNKQMSFSPYIGKSLDENMVAGILFIYARRRDRYLSPSYHRENQFDYGTGLFFRRYKSLGKGFYFFGNAQLDYSYTKLDYLFRTDPPEFQKIKGNHLRLAVYPGISYAINQAIHFEVRVPDLVGINYSIEKRHIEFPVNNKRDERDRNLNVSTALNENFGTLNFGFRFLLNQKKFE